VSEERETVAAAAAATPALETTLPTSDDDDDNKEYDTRIRKIAQKGIYEFEFVEGDKTGQKVKLGRKKISNRMMLELEEDRAEYASMISKFRNGPISKEERKQSAQMLTNLYAKLAKYYFHIEREDFDMMDWDSTKPNIDAAAGISVRGRPNVV
jgi:hypothetical protein